MPTLEEIASLAKVSRSTVSRVINNDPRVHKATRMRVQQVIQQLNFQPNLAARTLAGGRTQVIGLVIPSGVVRLFSDPYFPMLIQGITNACNEFDHSVMLLVAEPEYEIRMANRILHSRQMDGVIVSSMLVGDPVVQSLVQGNLPYVLVGRYLEEGSACYVDVENEPGGYAAVAYLAKKGRRRVATITGPKTMLASVDRLNGYLRAVHEFGLAQEESLIAEGEFTEESGYLAMKWLLPGGPDAVFCASDAMAFGAMRALRETKIRIPDQIAVIGFDDLSTAETTEPPLTTIHQPIQQLGFSAVELLIDRIHSDGQLTCQKILPTQLVIRKSA